MNGNLTLNEVLNVSSTTGFGNGLYNLINYTGTLTNNGVVVGSAPAGHTYAVGIGTASYVKLTIN